MYINNDIYQIRPPQELLPGHLVHPLLDLLDPHLFEQANEGSDVITNRYLPVRLHYGSELLELGQPVHGPLPAVLLLAPGSKALVVPGLCVLLLHLDTPKNIPDARLHGKCDLGNSIPILTLVVCEIIRTL